MLDTNEIFVGAQGFAPSVKLEIISIALFMKWYYSPTLPYRRNREVLRLSPLVGEGVGG